MKLTQRPADSCSPVRTGLLGCSDIARRKFIPALRSCSCARLTAVAGRNPAKAAAWGRDYSCRPLTAAELLADPDVELVYLSLPNHLHEEWAIKTLESGKHLLCEKPLSLSLPSAEKILHCARVNDRLVYENQMFLFHPQHALVREMIREGKIGAVRELRCVFGFPYPRPGNFRLDSRQGGGAFHDLARYPLGIASYLLRSAPKTFRGHVTWRGSLNTGVTGTAVTPNQEIFTFSIRFGQQYEAHYEVIGETGKIRVERAYTTPAEKANRLVLISGDTTTEIVVPPADHFTIMLEEICKLIRTSGDYSLFNRQARTIAELADLMQQGCMEGRDVC